MLARLSAFAILATAEAAPACLDHDGNSVDWYFIYKQPNGFNYAYHDAKQSSTTLSVEQGRQLANTVNNPLGKTLHQVYEHKKDYGYMLYNDEDPITDKKTGSGTAHAKGVMAADSSGSGFWLIHSVPKFPDLTTKDFTWKASTTYGQSFLCINLDKTHMDAAAKQMQYAKVQVFEHGMPSSIASILPNLDAVIKGTHLSGTSSQSFTSRGGASFTHFVKDPKWGQDGKDFYSDFVQGTLKTDLLVETWRRSPFSSTYCTSNTSHSHNTMNVQAMDFGSGNSFDYTQDHSKWAVDASSRGSYVCVGDINRMPSQQKRGGGTMCFKNSALHKGLSNAISDADSCKKGSAFAGSFLDWEVEFAEQVAAAQMEQSVHV